MASFAAALLDELMGRNRNADRINFNTDWSDPDVCKMMLCGFCPHDLFTNTRADLGMCNKIHDDELREIYEKSSRHLKMGYEEDFLRYLQTLVGDVDKRIERGHQRLELNKMAASIAGTPQNAHEEKSRVLTDRINELVEQAERLGCEGKVEEAQGVLKLCDQLKEERLALQDSVVNTLVPKEMEVCQICGAFLVVGDAPQRVEEHLNGKQHVGYSRCRAMIETLKKKLRGEDPEREARLKREREEYEKKKIREREAEREKDREKMKRREEEDAERRAVLERREREGRGGSRPDDRRDRRDNDSRDRERRDRSGREHSRGHGERDERDRRERSKGHGERDDREGREHSKGHGDDREVRERSRGHREEDRERQEHSKEHRDRERSKDRSDHYRQDRSSKSDRSSHERKERDEKSGGHRSSSRSKSSRRSGSRNNRSRSRRSRSTSKTRDRHRRSGSGDRNKRGSLRRSRCRSPLHEDNKKHHDKHASNEDRNKHRDKHENSEDKDKHHNKHDNNKHKLSSSASADQPQNGAELNKDTSKSSDSHSDDDCTKEEDCGSRHAKHRTSVSAENMDVDEKTASTDHSEFVGKALTNQNSTEGSASTNQSMAEGAASANQNEAVAMSGDSSTER